MLLIGRERGKGPIGKIPGPSPRKSGNPRESPKRTKKDKKGRTSPDRKPPRLKHPRLAALDFFLFFFAIAICDSSHESHITSDLGQSLSLVSSLLGISLLFLLQGIPCFFDRLASLSQDLFILGESEERTNHCLFGGFPWETDFYTPPVLGGADLLPFSAPAVYKNQGP